MRVDLLDVRGKRVSLWHDQALLAMGQVIGVIMEQNVLVVLMDRGVRALVDLADVNVLVLEEDAKVEEAEGWAQSKSN